MNHKFYSKHKRKILLYIKNYYELKVLYVSGTLEYLESNFDISILDGEENIVEDLKKLIKFKNIYSINIGSCSKFLLKIKIYLELVLLLLFNYRNSESCKQILIEKVLLTSSFFSKYKISNNDLFYLMDNKFIRNSLHYLATISTKFFKYKNKRVGKFCKNSYNFDFILFGSPYSHNLNFILKRFSTFQTKSIALIRNIDTVPCKGFFSSNFDYLIYPYEPIKESLKKFTHTKNPKKYLYLKNYNLNLKKSKKSRDIFKVCYAPSCTFLNPYDADLAFQVFKIISNKCKIPFQLQLRITPTVDKYIFRKKLASIDYEEYITPEININKKIIDEDVKELSTINILISSTSTIVVDAKILGVKTALINPHKSNNVLYKRDHILEMKNFYNIPILTNENDILEKFLIEH